MIKNAMKALCLMLGIVLCLSVTACGGRARSGNAVELSNYHGETISETTGLMEFNEELFYRNDYKVGGPDPFVFDDPKSDWYYCFGTGMVVYRTKDLVDWEPVGHAFDVDINWSETNEILYADVWAPEVVYDDAEDRYVMFVSATPKATYGVEHYMLMSAVSKTPYGPYEVINYADPSSKGYAGSKYARDYSGSEYDEYRADMQPDRQSFFNYLFLDPVKYYAALDRVGFPYSTYKKYGDSIDPHPFVDPKTGKKYLYVTAHGIIAVEMQDWYTPKYETLSWISYPEYYTVDDYKTAAGGEWVDTVYYENPGNTINEGPAMMYRNGKYYLTFSANDYTNNSYCVGQMVGDRPLGPFRKLTQDEHGLLLSVADGNEELAGVGHHSFVQKDGHTYIVYHRYETAAVTGDRGPSVDEIKWITIEDRDGNELDVMYVNGPTATVQPLPEAFSTYRNIAGEATVSGGSLEQGSSLKYLTDGLLSTYKDDDNFLETYIKETNITETSTFTFTFNTAQTVRAIMIYESKYAANVFRKVSRIELVCEEDGKEVIKVIQGLTLSQTLYTESGYDGSILYICSGASIFAEFYEQQVKSIKITVDVPENQAKAGISEIRILGK